METNVVVAAAYGGPEVLVLTMAKLAEIEPEEVLIEVRAAATNPVDYKLYGGAYGNDPSKLPMRLGFEAAGVVRNAVGEPVGPTGPIQVGDEVIVYLASGAYAGAIVTPASTVIAKPFSMSYEEASGLMLAGVTAAHALYAASVKRGDTVLIHGGAGGVGLMAIQLAAADGARVLATASEGAHDLLRELGAEPVTYGEGLLQRVKELALDGVDAAVDFVGSAEAADVSIELVGDRHRIVTIVADGRAASLGIHAVGGGADPGTEFRAAARLELVRRVEAGSLRVIVDSTYPLAEAADAHRELKSGHAHGKIVLIP
ncbi:MAG: NADP-dependent oxidoreductase [Acidimicrobiales bacterium]